MVYGILAVGGSKKTKPIQSQLLQNRFEKTRFEKTKPIFKELKWA
jgi:hypothetical protein